jgi:uncharacterized membrane protein
MTKTTPQATRDYLARLAAALSDVQPDVRAEIIAGVREELDGLDAEAATARIAELGDPTFIAAEATAATLAAEQSHPTEPSPSRTLPIIAVLLLIVGTFVVPVIAPIVGLVLVSFSAVWSRREKLATWLIPLATAVILVVAFAITSAVQAEVPTVPTNPLVPLASWHLAILLPYLVLPIEGIALLVRANGRGWRTVRSLPEWRR